MGCSTDRTSSEKRHQFWYFSVKNFIIVCVSQIFIAVANHLKGEVFIFASEVSVHGGLAPLACGEAEMVAGCVGGQLFTS
jgi:hypothetical protein